MTRLRRKRFATPAGGGRHGLVAVAALTAAVAVTATACGDSGGGASGGSGSEGSGKGRITFWDDNGGVRTDVWKQIIADFQKKYPGIEVKYVGVPQTEAQSKYDTAIQAGGVPDVGDVGTAMLAGIAAQGALEPLGRRYANSSLNGRINPLLLRSVESASGGDTLYTVPTSVNNGVLYYRTDLFEAAGLDAPTTWPKFYEAADKLTDRSRNAFGYTIRGGAGSIAQALDAMYGQSGITSFWNGGRTTVNDPKNVAALEKYAGLYKKDTPAADLGNDFTKMVAEWDSGRIGMLNHNLGSYQNHVKALGTDKFRGLPDPALPDGSRVMVSNPVDGLALFKASRNKAAAWKFIEFAASHESNSTWNRSAGQIPANTQAARDPWVRQSEPARLGAEALFGGRTTIVQLPYYLPDWNTISKSGNEPNFQKVLLGRMSAKDFLDTLADQLDKAQAEWRSRHK